MSAGEEKYLNIECKQCEKSSKIKLLYEHTVMDSAEDPGGKTFRFPFKCYYLCKCDNCSDVTLVLEVVLYEAPYEVVFPVEKRFINFELPELVQTSYQEAIGCEKSRLPLATLVMVGRTLEAIIKEFNEEETKIFNGLERLKDREIISEDIYQWGNELRVLRNIGAHAVKEEVTIKDAIEAMDFLQAILEIVYHLRPKFEQMKKRRNKSKLEEKS